MTGSSWRYLPSLHVPFPVVVFAGSRSQVLWIHAGWIVAGVQDTDTRRNFSVGDLE